MADIKRQVAGRNAKSNGKDFEKQLETIFTFYKNKGLMKVEKAHENFKPLRPVGKGQYICVACSSGQPDFRGCTHSGQTVVFEAKHTVLDKIAYSAVTEQEEKQLNEWESIGALCGVLVQYGNNNIYFYPWNVWKNMQSIFGFKHIKELHSDKYKATWIEHIDTDIDTILKRICELPTP